MPALGLTLGMQRRLRLGVSGPVYDSDAADYFERAESLGGSFNLGGAYTEEAVKGAWDTFVIALKADGTWDELDEIFPGCGVTFAGATAKLKHSGNPVVTLVNFVSGDYSSSGGNPGFKGNGTDKEINSNWKPSDTIIVPSGHHSMFTTEEATVTSREGSGSGADAIFNGFFPFLTLGVFSDMFSVAGGRINQVSEATQGSLILNGTASAHRMLLEGSVIASGTSPTGTLATDDYFFFSVGGAGYSDARRAVRTMGQGLTEEQETTLNNALQQLMSSLGYSIAP